MGPEYSVIVPAYNEEAELGRTLPALCAAMEQSGRAGELIVVDNNSSDRTAAAAAALGARVVFEPVNQISRARNAGARASAGRFLIFADADTVVSPGLLAAALRTWPPAAARAAGPRWPSTPTRAGACASSPGCGTACRSGAGWPPAGPKALHPF